MPLERPSNSNTRQAEAEDDRELVEAARGGDRQAFRALVERHQRRAYAIAFSLLRDESDAAEVVQEAFLRVYRGLATFQGGSSFFTWLYRIVTNLAIDVLRRPGRQADELDEARAPLDESDESSFPLLARVDGADPLDSMHRAELAGAIKAALDALPPYHRGVIIMREVEGLSYEEMAQAMGVSKGTIMSRLFHARQKLQRALSGFYQEGQRAAVPGDEAAAAAEEGGDP
ncbi:MAG TPA: sigma-70 family RNA polymerase sigma factor [Polyangiaceae bacterium]|nr:sigma-70 family RNA polymerase sigma factor [Polyangiaceae bacterium]